MAGATNKVRARTDAAARGIRRRILLQTCSRVAAAFLGISLAAAGLGSTPGRAQEPAPPFSRRSTIS